MRKKMTYKMIVEDCTQTDSCTQAELEALIGIFEYGAKKISGTLARKAWFELSDFATAAERGIDRFSLLLSREQVGGKEKWHGKFEYGSKSVKILGVLEDFTGHETLNHEQQK
jgi:hypothetical protein